MEPVPEDMPATAVGQPHTSGEYGWGYEKHSELAELVPESQGDMQRYVPLLMAVNTYRNALGPRIMRSRGMGLSAAYGISIAELDGAKYVLKKYDPNPAIFERPDNVDDEDEDDEGKVATTPLMEFLTEVYILEKYFPETIGDFVLDMSQGVGPDGERSLENGIIALTFPGAHPVSEWIRFFYVSQSFSRASDDDDDYAGHGGMDQEKQDYFSYILVPKILLDGLRYLLTLHKNRLLYGASIAKTLMLTVSPQEFVGSRSIPQNVEAFFSDYGKVASKTVDGGRHDVDFDRAALAELRELLFVCADLISAPFVYNQTAADNFQTGIEMLSNFGETGLTERTIWSFLVDLQLLTGRLDFPGLRQHALQRNLPAPDSQATTQRGWGYRVPTPIFQDSSIFAPDAVEKRTIAAFTQDFDGTSAFSVVKPADLLDSIIEWTGGRTPGLFEGSLTVMQPVRLPTPPGYTAISFWEAVRESLAVETVPLPESQDTGDADFDFENRKMAVIPGPDNERYTVVVTDDPRIFAAYLFSVLTLYPARLVCNKNAEFAQRYPQNAYVVTRRPTGVPLSRYRIYAAGLGNTADFATERIRFDNICYALFAEMFRIMSLGMIVNFNPSQIIITENEGSVVFADLTFALPITAVAVASDMFEDRARAVLGEAFMYLTGVAKTIRPTWQFGREHVLFTVGRIMEAPRFGSMLATLETDPPVLSAPVRVTAWQEIDWMGMSQPESQPGVQAEAPSASVHVPESPLSQLPSGPQPQSQEILGPAGSLPTTVSPPPGSQGVSLSMSYAPYGDFLFEEVETVREIPQESIRHGVVGQAATYEAIRLLDSIDRQEMRDELRGVHRGDAYYNELREEVRAAFPERPRRGWRTNEDTASQASTILPVEQAAGVITSVFELPRDAAISMRQRDALIADIEAMQARDQQAGRSRHEWFYPNLIARVNQAAARGAVEGSSAMLFPSTSGKSDDPFRVRLNEEAHLSRVLFDRARTKRDKESIQTMKNLDNVLDSLREAMAPSHPMAPPLPARTVEKYMSEALALVSRLPPQDQVKYRQAIFKLTNSLPKNLIPDVASFVVDIPKDPSGRSLSPEQAGRLARKQVGGGNIFLPKVVTPVSRARAIVSGFIVKIGEWVPLVGRVHKLAKQIVRYSLFIAEWDGTPLLDESALAGRWGGLVHWLVWLLEEAAAWHLMWVMFGASGLSLFLPLNMAWGAYHNMRGLAGQMKDLAIAGVIRAIEAVGNMSAHSPISGAAMHAFRTAKALISESVFSLFADNKYYRLFAGEDSGVSEAEYRERLASGLGVSSETTTVAALARAVGVGGFVPSDEVLFSGVKTMLSVGGPGYAEFAEVFRQTVPTLDMNKFDEEAVPPVLWTAMNPRGIVGTSGLSLAWNTISVAWSDPDSVRPGAVFSFFADAISNTTMTTPALQHQAAVVAEQLRFTASQMDFVAQQGIRQQQSLVYNMPANVALGATEFANEFSLLDDVAGWAQRKIHGAANSLGVSAFFFNPASILGSLQPYAHVATGGNDLVMLGIIFGLSFRFLFDSFASPRQKEPEAEPEPELDPNTLRGSVGRRSPSPGPSRGRSRTARSVSPEPAAAPFVSQPPQSTTRADAAAWAQATLRATPIFMFSSE